MGNSSGPFCIDSRQKEEDLKSQNGAKIQATAASSNRPSLIIEASEFDTRVRTLVQKMVWEFGLGLSCVKKGQRKAALKQQQENERDSSSSNEHNKAWLLAESGGREQHFDSQSVHSSFRFSFGSQLDHDLNSHSASSSSSSVAAVLMVNLDNGLRESLSRDLKWRRIESLERSISPVAHTLVRYTYSEIRSATRNFSKGRVLGRGALSYVYKGRFGFRRTAVAIKRLDKEDKESAKAFCRELMIASSLRNRNIVPLLGFCIDPDEGLFLIYKYVSGGSLEYHLHEKQRGLKGCSSLPWSVRYKVALEIAEAVEYLHNGTDRCVVHRDIKPSNILLSSKKIPKLCDFGLATWTPGPSVPFLCKTVKGTFGYLAPEYFQHGKVSDKTDVYAFGVVLLELLTGRKPFEDRRAPGEENLVLWAKPILQKGESIEVLIDPKLKLRPHNSSQVTRMVQAAAACISSEESRRPNIDNVISILRGEENYCLTRSKSTFSENSCVLDCYPHLHDLQSKGEMRSHFALAMLGVSDIEDDDHYLYCR